MADTETELREVIEAQEIVIRAGAEMLRDARQEVDRLWGHLDRETKLRESIQTLYNERIATPRRRVQDDARVVEARQLVGGLAQYLKNRPDSVLLTHVYESVNRILKALA
jgi:hypothetical protein